MVNWYEKLSSKVHLYGYEIAKISAGIKPKNKLTRLSGYCFKKHMFFVYKILAKLIEDEACMFLTKEICLHQFKLWINGRRVFFELVSFNDELIPIVYKHLLSPIIDIELLSLYKGHYTVLYVPPCAISKSKRKYTLELINQVRQREFKLLPKVYIDKLDLQRLNSIKQNRWKNLNLMYTEINLDDEDTGEIEEENCTICLDKLYDTNTNKKVIQLIGCNHCFHKKCLNNLILFSTNCPMCRHHYKLEQLI